MARSRNIKPGFFLNEGLGGIEPLARLLFVGLWCIADREGRLEDRPKRIKIEVLPYDDCDADKLLASLHDAGFIERYSADGNDYIQINNFAKHQNPHPKEAASVIPAPPNGNGKKVASRVKVLPSNLKSVARNADSLIPHPSSFNSHTDSFNSNVAADAAECDESIPAEKSSDGQETAEDDGAQPKAGKDGYTEDFETFWDQYPRHVEKKTAFKVWKTRLKEKTKPEDMIQAAVNYATQCQREGTETRYIKHASTFIGPNKPFEEYIKGPPEPPDPGGGEPVSWGPLRQLYAEYEAEERGDST